MSKNKKNINYSDSSYFYNTEKYTLVPLEGYNELKRRVILSELYDIEENDIVYTKTLENFGAALIYALPGDKFETRQFKNEQVFPLILKLLSKISQVESHNKVLILVSESLLNIVAMEGDSLLLSASYKVNDSVTASYYIFLVMRELFFNPAHTPVSSLGVLSEDLVKILEKYTAGVISIA